MDEQLGSKMDGLQRLQGKEMAPRIALGTLVALLVVGFTMHLRWLLSLPNLPEAFSKARSWLQVLRGNELLALTFVIGPFATLFAFVIGLLVRYGMPQVWQSARRSLQVGGLLGACLAAAWFVGTTRLDTLRGAEWLFFVPIVPPALLAFQAMNTWRQRPRSVGDFRIGVSAQLRKALEESGDVSRFEEVHRQLLRVFGGVVTVRPTASRTLVAGSSREAARRGSRSPTSFATQFAVPGLLLLLVGFGAMSLATSHGPFLDVVPNPTALWALKWGVAGACRL